jgi:hypothetical protein
VSIDCTSLKVNVFGIITFLIKSAKSRLAQVDHINSRSLIGRYLKWGEPSQWFLFKLTIDFIRRPEVESTSVAINGLVEGGANSASLIKVLRSGRRLVILEFFYIHALICSQIADVWYCGRISLVWNAQGAIIKAGVLE